MARIDILAVLDQKWEDGTRPRDLFAAHVAPDPAAYVTDLVAGLDAKSARVRNGCAELCSLLAATRPELLYPHLAKFQARLDSRDKAVRWEAVCTTGSLAAVDRAGLTRASVAPIGRHLADESIVLQGHAVRALAKLARSFPDLAPGILRQLVAAAPRFPGTRVGFLVEAMAAFAGDAALAARAAKFLERHVESDLGPVRTKARRAWKALQGARGETAGRARR
jgi:hypothetical protein